MQQSAYMLDLMIIERHVHYRRGLLVRLGHGKAGKKGLRLAHAKTQALSWWLLPETAKIFCHTHVDISIRCPAQERTCFYTNVLRLKLRDQVIPHLFMSMTQLITPTVYYRLMAWQQVGKLRWHYTSKKVLALLVDSTLVTFVLSFLSSLTGCSWLFRMSIAPRFRRVVLCHPSTSSNNQHSFASYSPKTKIYSA